MRFEPKLVALDIDGTLVDAVGTLPVEVHRAVNDVVAAGVPVVLSTGRSWASTKIVFDQLGLPAGWAVSSNGAKVLQYPPLVVAQETLFDPEATIREVAALAPEARIAVEEHDGWRATAAFPEGELTGDVTLCSWEELATGGPVARIVIRDPEGDEQKFMDLVKKLNLHEVAYFIGWSAWLDIAPHGVDKAHGLTFVTDQLGIDPADVLAIGDGRNDIEMLQWAGRGVAMGNAPQEVKAVADHVTGHFDDLGQVAELRRWF